MKYRTIVADPPWEYDEGFVSELKAGAVLRQLPYRSMPIEEIAELPVRGLADRDCRLFLWATSKWLEDAFDVIRSWGFRYVQTLIWEKPDPNHCTGSLASNAEFLLVARRGTPPRLGRFPGPVIRVVGGAHSQKPEVWMDYIEQVSPGPYLEMFSRRARFGWDCWGDEALNHVQIGAA